MKFNNKIFSRNDKLNNAPKRPKRHIGIVLILFTVVIIGLTNTAHAGIATFVGNLLGNKASASENTNKPVKHSQTLALLQAHASLNPTSNSTDLVPVDDGKTLVADIAASNAPAVESAQISTYLVREGDTLSSVAKMFDVSINTILWANDLNGKSILKPGQTLIILPITGITYTVKNGDTLKSIAMRYKADQEDILSYNDLTVSSVLKTGQTIIIPNVEAVIPSASRNVIKVPNEPLHNEVSEWPSFAGFFIRPLKIGIITQKLHGRNAIDIGAPAGTPIYAMANGTVIISKTSGGWNGGYGNYVVISHSNGTQTLYSHMSKGSVTVGQAVKQGQVIGYVGNTGLSTGNHLHFEVRGGQNPITM